MEYGVIESTLNLAHRVCSKIHTFVIGQALFSIGHKTTIVPPFRFGNLARILMGNRVTINANCWIQVLIGHGNDFPAPNIIFHDNVSIGMGSTISAACKITFEEYVFTARNFYVSDHEHEFQDIDKPIVLQGISKIKEVRIGARTWIGQNVVILPGVNIGRHCVIGANSVVNKDIPDYSVVAGVPAKILRQFDQSIGEWIRVKN